MLLLPVAPVSAADITVSGNCSFEEAVGNANAGDQTNSDCASGSSGADKIILTGDVTLTGTDALRITSSLTIDGKGYKITGSRDAHLLQFRGTLSAVINDVTMTNSTALTDDEGAAIYASIGPSIEINDSIFENNTALLGGSTIYIEGNAGDLTINDSVFKNNRATDGGGGAIAHDPRTAPLTISNSTFSNNSATGSGGAVYAAANTTSISGSTFTNNSAGRGGGALRFGGNSGATLSISDSVFTGNSAADNGGAIHTGNATATINRSYFANNTSSGSSGTGGGGALLVADQVTVENSTFYNNRATNTGGAANLLFSNTSLTVRHATFVDNSATNAGKTIYATAGHTLNIYNSIITSSVAGDDCVNADVNTNNIITDGSCSTATGFSVDPLLASRAGNVYPLRQGSPAIDAANPVACSALSEAVDQRGATRPAGAFCDIGAYEGFILPPPPPSAGGGSDDDADSASAPGTPCVFCADLIASGLRLQARNGFESGVQFRRVEAGAIGDQSLLAAGFMDAVDAYGWVEQGVGVCFPQSGRLLFLDAATSPRAQVSLDGYRQAGMTCAEFDRPGTLLLLPGPAPIRTAPAQQATTTRATPLSGCMVTTLGLLRFRDAPGGAPLRYTDPWGRQENGWLPSTVTLTALERTADWFKVDYYGTRGWVSAHHVTPQGTCG